MPAFRRHNQGETTMRWGRFWGWLLILGIGSLFCTVNLDAQPDDILLDEQSVFAKRQRPAVDFPHMQHIDAELECSDCHHRFKDGENIQDEAELEEDAEGIKCAACHKNEPDFRFKPDLDPTRRTLQQGYHRMCMGCHRKLRKEKRKAGPMTCGACHPWKKATQS